MNQGHAVFFQIAGNVLEVQAHVFLAHVLKHPHGSDIVPLPVTQFPVVGQLDFRNVLQPFGFNRLSDQVVLLFAQGHPGNLQAIFPGRRQHQGPPATADVQQSLALFRVQLVQDMVDLGNLRFLQVIYIAIGEVGAGISQGIVQPELVKIIADIVVALNVADGLALAVALLWQKMAQLRIAHEAFGAFISRRQELLDAPVNFDLLVHIGFAQGKGGVGSHGLHWNLFIEGNGDFRVSGSIHI